MARIFAALDAAGEIRFVGDVPRGSACGCFCPVCRSPLVARLGEVNEWHFAHVADQEREDCVVGAINLLRRLGAEYLSQLAQLSLPPYSEVVRLQTFRATETVTWSAQPVGLTHLVLDGSEGAPPSLLLRLDSGVEAEVHVQVDGSEHARPEAPAGRATVLFSIPLATPSELRTRSSALEVIAQRGRWVWQHHPDSLGLVAAARGRLEKAATAHAAHQSGRQRAAGAHWAQIRRSAFRPSEAMLAEEPAAPSDAPALPTTAPAPTQALSWAKDRKAKSGFILYRLKSGEAWVIYTLQDGSNALIPWPDRFDGWDESLPASFTAVDPELDAYRVTNLTAAMTFLATRAAVVRNTYDPLELLRL